MCCQLLLSILYFYEADGARILAIVSLAFYSHQVAYRPLWRELSLRGHQVTVMTTDPMHDGTLTNLTEIDMSYTYDIYKKHDIVSVASDDRKSFAEKVRRSLIVVREAQDAQLASTQVQNLIHGDGKFDLLIVEAHNSGMMAFSWRFQCPMIGVASLDAAMQYHDSMGNVVHPVVTHDPNIPVEDYQDMTFTERLTSFLYMVIYKLIVYKKVFPEEDDSLKQYFGNDLPPIWDIQRNMSMLFINTHPLFAPMRPMNPNTIIVSGLHIGKPKPLPKELAEFLDEAQEGVIYFSLGSNIRADLYNRTMNVKAILEAVAEVPYKILWKIDMKLENITQNVRVEKWLPQQDVLRHPNIKLFITQGGIQSLQEAIINHVPILGIPVFGDQFNNVNMMVKHGCGIKLDGARIDKQTFKDALTQAIVDPRYKQRAREIGEMFKDEPKRSLQRAVYWTEYVIKHHGAPHLRSKVPDLPYWKYYMFDIVGTIIAGLIVVFVLLYFVVSLVIKFINCFRCKAKLD